MIHDFAKKKKHRNHSAKKVNRFHAALKRLRKILVEFNYQYTIAGIDRHAEKESANVTDIRKNANRRAGKTGNRAQPLDAA